MSAFYITTAIEYANGEPHLGHAFEKIGADAIGRYHHLRGDDVHLLVGTDDHGAKVARAAQAAGIPPREQADRISAAFRRTWDTLGIGYDLFVRTTTPHHAIGVRAIIDRILERHLREDVRGPVLRWVRGVSYSPRARGQPLSDSPGSRYRAGGRVELVLPAQRVRRVSGDAPAQESGLRPT